MTPAETCAHLRWLTADGAPDMNRFYFARSVHALPGRKVAGRLLCHREQIDRWALTGETSVRSFVPALKRA